MEPESESKSKTDAEDSQVIKKSKSDREIKSQVDDNSGGVKFYELDDSEDKSMIIDDESSPKITMPSFKKRVHSQRIPQRERPAVTPYDGAYDQKYSSDEDNVEYEVDEPEEAMDRSNSSVTFSEDIYDSDAIDEMMKNQIQKSSQMPREGFAKSEGTLNVLEIVMPKSILKDGNEKMGSKKKESLIKIVPRDQGENTSLIHQKKITSNENVSDADSSKSTAATTEEIKLMPDALPSEKVKADEKGEKFLPDLTKPPHGLEIKETHKITDEISPVIDKSEVVTKSLRSTISRQIDQITDSATTNKDDFSKKDEAAAQNVTKPLQDASSKDSCAVTPLNVLSKDIITDELVKSTARQPEKILKPVNEAWKQELISFSKETEELLEKATLTREKCHVLAENSLDLDSETLETKGEHEIQSADVRVEVTKQKLIDHKTTKAESDGEKESETGDLIRPLKAVDDLFSTEGNVSAKSDETKEKDLPFSKTEQITIHVTSDGDEVSDLEETLGKDSKVDGMKPTVMSREDVAKKAEEIVSEITQTAERLLLQKLNAKTSDAKGEEVEDDLFETLMNKSEVLMSKRKIPEDAIKASKDFIKNESHVIPGTSHEAADSKNNEKGLIDEAVVPVKHDKPFIDVTSETGMKTAKDSVEFSTSPQVNNLKSGKEVKLLNNALCDVAAGEKEIANELDKSALQTNLKKPEVSLVGDETKLTDVVQEIVSKDKASKWTAEPIDVSKESTASLEKNERERMPKSLTLVKDFSEEKSSQINKDAIKTERITIPEITENLSLEKTEVLFTTPQIVSQKQTEKVVGKSFAHSPTKDSKSNEDKLNDFKQEKLDFYPASSELETKKVEPARTEPSSNIWSNLSSGITSSMQDTFTTITGISSEPEPQIEDALEKSSNESEKVGLSEPPTNALSAEFADETVTEESKDVVGKDLESPDSDSQPRVIFRIESEDELMSDAENDWLPSSNVSSPTHEFGEKIKKELKATFEKEQKKLEQRLASMKSGIFDISRESLSRTKELVDERLRKISEIKPPKIIDDFSKSETKTDIVDEIKIGRFHITPALVDEVVAKEAEISERLKATRKEDEEKEEIEKELPEKLTEADFEEVIRELQLEGLKTEVFFQPEDKEKEEKKERTLKRVERRFERMASETLEKEKEEEDSGELHAHLAKMS